MERSDQEDTPAQNFLKGENYPEICRKLNRLLRALYALDPDEIRACRELFLKYKGSETGSGQKSLF